MPTYRGKYPHQAKHMQAKMMADNQTFIVKARIHGYDLVLAITLIRSLESGLIGFVLMRATVKTCVTVLRMRQRGQPMRKYKDEKLLTFIL